MAKKRRRRRRKISRREKIFNIVSYSLMAAVALGFLVWAFLTRGSVTIKGSIEDYFNAVNKEDVKKYIECCYPKKWEKTIPGTSDSFKTLALFTLVVVTTSPKTLVLL